MRPSRQLCVFSIGFDFWRVRICSRICSFVVFSIGGRNLCSGGSSRWIVIGRLVIVLKIFLKFDCWWGKSFLSVCRCFFLFDVMIIFCMIGS